MDSELRKLQREVENLKKKKEYKLKYATSITERNKLLSEIKQLDEVGKSPSALKNFGRTFGRGLKMTGKKLWGSIQRGSKNLSKNSPEFRAMEKKPQNHYQPMSDMGMYSPNPINTEPMKIVKHKINKKGKKNKRQVMHVRSGVENPMTWKEFP